ncbi:MAG: hypothetical protein ACU4EQ_00660 [Candidatus Nitrosoglobus sp.]
MFQEDLPAVFVTHASGILGDTSKGLSGSEIVRTTAAYAIDANVDIPYASYPFAGRMGINKRTALYENLMAFPSNWRYKIIRELCDHPTIKQLNALEASKLKVQLFTRYGYLDNGNTATDLNHAVVEETRHWLSAFPKALPLYNGALQKLEHGVFDRNVLDDLRLALEALLHDLLGNRKSLENQIQPLGAFIKERGGHPSSGICSSNFLSTMQNIITLMLSTTQQSSPKR